MRALTNSSTSRLGQAEGRGSDGVTAAVMSAIPNINAMLSNVQQEREGVCGYVCGVGTKKCEEDINTTTAGEDSNESANDGDQHDPP